jgi:hypothetical protein
MQSYHCCGNCLSVLVNGGLTRTLLSGLIPQMTKNETQEFVACVGRWTGQPVCSRFKRRRDMELWTRKHQNTGDMENLIGLMWPGPITHHIISSWAHSLSKFIKLNQGTSTLGWHFSWVLSRFPCDLQISKIERQHMLGNVNWRVSPFCSLNHNTEKGAKLFLAAYKIKPNRSRWVNLLTWSIYTHYYVYYSLSHQNPQKGSNPNTHKILPAHSFFLTSAVFHIEVDALTVLRAFPRIITTTVTSSWYFLLLPTGILINCSAVKAARHRKKVVKSWC